MSKARDLADSADLNFDSNTLAIDTVNNRVGIGTATPLNELDVNGSIRISLDGGVIGNGDEKIKFDEAGQTIQFQAADAERMRIESNRTQIKAPAINTSRSASNILAQRNNMALFVRGTGANNTFSNIIQGIAIGDDATCGMFAYDAGAAAAQNLVFYTGNNTGCDERLIITQNSVVVTGSFSKGSGSFKIDHPLESKTDTHHLVHSFVEAPQADNIYRGKVDLVAGLATVNIDTVAGMTGGTFVALNREVQCFTSNESGWTAVKGSVSGNILTIEAQDDTCTDTISWLVVGERQDQHMYDTDWTNENGKVIVEPEKVADEDEGGE